MKVVIHLLDGTTESHNVEMTAIRDGVLTLLPFERSKAIQYPLTSIKRWDTED